uniref:COesterase domain-containing protein n=1 Tax=Strongyloides papillosus TaxID=174720 RepID=A0A0N5C4M6_STREA
MISWYCVLSLILQLAYFLKSFRLNTNHGCIDAHPTEVHPDVTEFLGVPFALPPMGPLRFKPPKILTHDYYNYAGHCFNAMYPAKACLFKKKAVEFVGIDEWQPKNSEIHENCLRLNMWVPKNKTGGVIVFFNGRSYHSCFGPLPQYDATILSHKTGLIVVNVNYIDGTLGFAHLKRKKFVPGNIGLLDQQMALNGFMRISNILVVNNQ